MQNCCSEHLEYKHISVMPAESIYYLNCRPGKTFVDCTLGASGHAAAILNKITPGGLLIGIDQDIDAIKNAKKTLKPFKANIRLFNDNFINLPSILSELNISSVDGIMIDLGISLHQLKASGRGFSFNKDEPLDMRMDIRSDTRAEDLVNGCGEKQLADIFREYGDEHRAHYIARKIITERKQRAIKTSKQLADIVKSATPAKQRFKYKIHPATRVFMSLRIAVNRELERLELFMNNVPNVLSQKGRICVLSFHSLEDRIVKRSFKAMEAECICPPGFPQCVCSQKKSIRILTKKIVRPSETEIAENPLARSAGLRAAEKI